MIIEWCMSKVRVWLDIPDGGFVLVGPDGYMKIQTIFVVVESWVRLPRWECMDAVDACNGRGFKQVERR